jgi:hypothetical protein
MQEPKVGHRYIGRCLTMLPHRHADSLSLEKENALNIYVVVASLSLALLLAVIALLRETRLRQALQALLRRLLLHWRANDQETDTVDDRRRRVDEL